MGRTALLLLACAAIIAGCDADDETTTISVSSPPADEPAKPGRDPVAGDAGRGPEPVLEASEVRELERFAANAPGAVGFALAPLADGEPVVVGEARSGRAWSTMKVPLLVALIDRVGGVDELSATERAQAEASLTASDNEAALALFDRLGALEGGPEGASAAIEAVLRRAGDRDTEVNTEPSPEGFSTYGQTQWSTRASALFFRALAGGCLLGGGDTDFVLSLLRDVVADQRWGLGQADTPDDAQVGIKGGWGPEPGGGYLVRQSGVVTDGANGYVLSVIAVPDDTSEESFTAGQDLVSEAADLVARQAGAGPRASVTCGP